MISYNTKVNSEVRNASFSDSNLEELIKDIKEFTPSLVSYGSINSENLKQSYIAGAKYVMSNLVKLYDITKNSFGGFLMIAALNTTVNKKVLGNFFKTVKYDLGISKEEKIFSGGKLDIPIAYNMIESLQNKIGKTNNIDFDAYILGAKRVVDVIDYAYNAPLTTPKVKEFVKNKSKGIVKNIANKLALVQNKVTQKA